MEIPITDSPTDPNPTIDDTVAQEIINKIESNIPRCIVWSNIPKEVDETKVEAVFIDSDKRCTLIKDPDGDYFSCVVFLSRNERQRYEIHYRDVRGRARVYGNDDLLEVDDQFNIEEFDTKQKLAQLEQLMYNEMIEQVKLRRVQSSFNPKFAKADVGEKVVRKQGEDKRITTEEEKYVQIRDNYAKQNLPKWIKLITGKDVRLNNNNYKRIGIAASGGGLRASIGTRYFTQKIQKEGLLDCVPYYCSLSGSTWFLSDWIYNGFFESTDSNQRDWLMPNTFTSKFSNVLLSLLVYKSERLLRRPTSTWFIEAWSTVLTASYFPNSNPRLSDMKTLSPIAHPWPIMTAIEVNEDPKANPDPVYSPWVEFTPTQVTTIKQKQPWVGVKTSAFGCKIQNGKKVASPTGDDLSQLIAVWGSAPAITLQEYEIITNNNNFSFLSVFLKRLFSHHIVPPFEIPHIDNPTNNTFLRDAGISFNVPFPPLLEPERNVGVIIALDFSEELYEEPGNALTRAYEWANTFMSPNPLPKLEPKENADYWRNAHVIDVPGYPLVVYVPAAIKDASKRVPTFATAHDEKAKQIIFDEVDKSWEAVKFELAKKIAERMDFKEK